MTTLKEITQLPPVKAANGNLKNIAIKDINSIIQNDDHCLICLRDGTHTTTDYNLTDAINMAANTALHFGLLAEEKKESAARRAFVLAAKNTPEAQSITINADTTTTGTITQPHYRGEFGELLPRGQLILLEEIYRAVNDAARLMDGQKIRDTDVEPVMHALLVLLKRERLPRVTVS